jgi:hypothetical protein
LVNEACGQLQGPHGQGTEGKKYSTARERFMECAQYLYLEFLNIATGTIPDLPDSVSLDASIIALKTSIAASAGSSCLPL